MVTLREWLNHDKFGLAVSQGLCCEPQHLGAVVGLASGFDDGERGLRAQLVAVSGASSGAKIAAILAQPEISLSTATTWLRGMNFKRVFDPADLTWRGGLLSGDALVALLGELWGPNKRIEDCGIPLGISAFDIFTGPVVLVEGNLAQACQGSGSFPGLFSPVLLDRRWLWDFAFFTDPAGVDGLPKLGRVLQIAAADWNWRSWLVRSPRSLGADSVCSIVLQKQRRILPVPFTATRAQRAFVEARDGVHAALDRPLIHGAQQGHFLCLVEPPSTGDATWPKLLAGGALLTGLVLLTRGGGSSSP